MIPVRHALRNWTLPLLSSSSLFAVALLTTPSTYTVAHGVMVASLYVMTALGLHLATQLATRISRLLGALCSFAVVLIFAWHVREHLRAAGTYPSLDDPTSLACFLTIVSIVAVVYAAVVAMVPLTWSKWTLLGGTVMSLVGFVSLLSVFYFGSNTLRWHIHRHNRLIGPVAYHLLADDVAAVKTRLWKDHQLDRSHGATPASARVPTQGATQRGPNIVFILVDTLRADAVSKIHMPRVSQFAERAFVFSDVRANSSWTQPSVASFFTGLLPEEHGAIHGSRLSANNVTLAEVLSAAGYRTAAFVANTAVVRAAQGFDQGFDEYFELNASQPYVQGEEVTRAVHDWLGAGSLADRGGNDAPVFLYVHYMDPHTPYMQGSASNPPSDTKAVAEYAAELTYLDTHLADLLIGVKRQLSGQTAILVTSDHGEELGEHGERGHGHTLYGEVTRIPAVLSTGWEADTGPISARLEGRDFWDLVLLLADSSNADVREWARTKTRATRYASVYNAHHNSALYRLFRPRWANVVMRSIEDEKYRLIWSGLGQTYELYDLETDPAELNNVVEQLPDTVDGLVEVMESAASRWVETSPAHRSQETLERLRSLGYIR